MINGLSLFSNVGIGELNLKKCGINIIIANEIEKDRAAFYKSVYPECNVINEDINKCYKEIIELAKKNNCKFLMATPPCQGMSVVGRRDKNDKRNQLIIPVLNAIKDIEPDYVLIENVPQLLNFKIEYNNNYDTVENIIENNFGEKYHINKNKILNAQDYGVPQNRKRCIILMSKYNNWEFPQKEKHLVTVRDVIGDFPSVEAVVEGNINYFEGNDRKIEECKNFHPWHKPKTHAQRHVEIMRHTPTGHSAFENEYYYPRKENGERVSRL